LSLCLAGQNGLIAAPQPAVNPTVTGLISDLSADDASARKLAAQKLVTLGLSARPAVLAAMHGNDPETAAQAANVLLQMPWSDPSDPPAVKQILDQYTHFALAPDNNANQVNPGNPGNPVIPPNVVVPANPAEPALSSEDHRKAAVTALAGLEKFAGFDALARLVYEDPSNSVRWLIVHDLRTVPDDDAHLSKLRRTDPPADDPPLAALYGMAWMETGAKQWEGLFRQAVAEEMKSPGDDGGEVDFLVNSLVDFDEAAGHYDSAAQLLRQELKRGAPTDRQDVPLPLLRLFALHADHGPLAGFDADQKLAADHMQSPKLLYAMARIDLRQNQPDQAAAARAAAFNANSTSRLGRFQTGRYLSDMGWISEAEAEFKAYLAMPPGDDQDDEEASEPNAYFELSSLAAARDDDQAAGDAKKSAMSILGGTNATLQKNDGHGHTWTATEDQIWAEIHWRYLRAAVKRKDETTINHELAELILLKPNDEDIAIDAVPALKSRQRADDAAKLFADAYQDARAKLDADPKNPVLMNGLAWLEAKCDEKLDEALTLATAAVTADPDDAAMIDTLAEVNFHIGKPAVSAQLETRALQIQPGDPFMTGQLARFKAAAKE
jgi:predicted Zn-dependent protease